VRGWRRKALDRDVWEQVLEQAKAHQGLRQNDDDDDDIKYCCIYMRFSSVYGRKLGY